MIGEVVKYIEISDDVFAVPFNQAVVHQAMVRQLANARQGTASTKSRGEVRGSHQKLFRQKGTGQARAGSRRSPIRRGGGVAFGPKPKSYRQEMPKKMHRLALKSLLSAKVEDKELVVLEKLELDEPKTKEIVKLLVALGISSSSALITTSQSEEKVVKSARNLVGVKTIPARLLNVVDILSHKVLLMPEVTVRQVEQLWGKRLIDKGESSASL
jgi:large subunit ribosomal protein L4